MKSGSKKKRRKMKYSGKQRSVGGSRHNERREGIGMNVNSNNLINEEMSLSEASKSNVKVLVRIRPLQKQEIDSTGRLKCLRSFSDEPQVIEFYRPSQTSHQQSGQQRQHQLSSTQPSSRFFTYDKIFNDKTTQFELFEKSGIKNLLDSTLDGFSSTIFSFGITSSGKTYTLLGKEDEQLSNKKNFGVAPRSAMYIFENLTRIKNENTNQYKISFNVDVCFLEIYKSQVNDLLNLTTGMNLPVRQNNKLGFYVENLFIVNCKSFNDVMEVLKEGCTNRAVAEHEMNIFSSRSHSIFSIYVEIKTIDVVDGFTTIKRGKINICDLAGSERLKLSKSDGQTKKETGHINTSLLTLGKVINSITKKTSFKHIPYRESNLTKLLMDSLGGETKTMVIGNVTPSLLHVDETMNTLKFLMNCKKIHNKPVANVQQFDNNVVLMKKLKEENDNLKNQIARGKMKDMSSSEEGGIEKKGSNYNNNRFSDMANERSSRSSRNKKRDNYYPPLNPKFAKALADKEKMSSEMSGLRQQITDLKELISGGELLSRPRPPPVFKPPIKSFFTETDNELLKNKSPASLRKKFNDLKRIMQSNLKGDKEGIELLSYIDDPSIIFAKIIQENKKLKDLVTLLKREKKEIEIQPKNDSEFNGLRNEIKYLKSILTKNSIEYDKFKTEIEFKNIQFSQPERLSTIELPATFKERPQRKGVKKIIFRPTTKEKIRPKMQRPIDLPAPIQIQRVNVISNERSNNISAQHLTSLKNQLSEISPKSVVRDDNTKEKELEKLFEKEKDEKKKIQDNKLKKVSSPKSPVEEEKSVESKDIEVKKDVPLKRNKFIKKRKKQMKNRRSLSVGKKEYKPLKPLPSEEKSLKVIPNKKRSKSVSNKTDLKKKSRSKSKIVSGLDSKEQKKVGEDKDKPKKRKRYPKKKSTKKTKDELQIKKDEKSKLKKSKSQDIREQTEDIINQMIEADDGKDSKKKPEEVVKNETSEEKKENEKEQPKEKKATESKEEESKVGEEKKLDESKVEESKDEKVEEKKEEEKVEESKDEKVETKDEEKVETKEEEKVEETKDEKVETKEEETKEEKVEETKDEEKLETKEEETKEEKVEETKDEKIETKDEDKVEESKDKDDKIGESKEEEKVEEIIENKVEDSKEKSEVEESKEEKVEEKKEEEKVEESKDDKIGESKKEETKEEVLLDESSEKKDDSKEKVEENTGNTNTTEESKIEEANEVKKDEEAKTEENKEEAKTEENKEEVIEEGKKEDEVKIVENKKEEKEEEKKEEEVKEEVKSKDGDENKIEEKTEESKDDNEVESKTENKSENEKEKGEEKENEVKENSPEDSTVVVEENTPVVVVQDDQKVVVEENPPVVVEENPQVVIVDDKKTPESSEKTEKDEEEKKE